MTCAQNVAMSGCSGALVHDTVNVKFTITPNPSTTYYGPYSGTQAFSVYKDSTGLPPVTTGSPPARPNPASPPWWSGGVLCCDAGPGFASGAVRAIVWTGSTWVLRYYCQPDNCGLADYEDIPLVSAKSRLCPPNFLLWFEGDTVGVVAAGGSCGQAGVHVVAKVTDACVLNTGRYPAVRVGRRNGRKVFALDACDCLGNTVLPLPTCPTPCWFPPLATAHVTFSGFPSYCYWFNGATWQPLNGHSLELTMACAAPNVYGWHFTPGQTGVDATTGGFSFLAAATDPNGMVVGFYDTEVLAFGFGFNTYNLDVGSDACRITISHGTASWTLSPYPFGSQVIAGVTYYPCVPPNIASPPATYPACDTTLDVYPVDGFPCDFTASIGVTFHRDNQDFDPVTGAPTWTDFSGVLTISP